MWVKFDDIPQLRIWDIPNFDTQHNKKFKQFFDFSQFGVFVKSYLKAFNANKHKLMRLRNYFVAYSTILIYTLS